jgi:hypothetical protein
MGMRKKMPNNCHVYWKYTLLYFLEGEKGSSVKEVCSKSVEGKGGVNKWNRGREMGWREWAVFFTLMQESGDTKV